MKIHIQTIIKRHLEVYLFIGISAMSLLTIGANLATLKKIKQPILIAIDPNGTRIIQDQEDPIFKTEASAFIQRFVMSLYNFTPDNFLQKLGPATAMMSEQLWKSRKDEILSLKKKVEDGQLTLSAQLVKITKDDSGYFHILLRTTEKSRLSSQDRNILVTLKLNSVPRTHENPYGLEVEEYNEEVIR